MVDQKLVDELEKALRDEAYDGWFGYMGGEQFTAYVRTLAVTAAKVVEEAHNPTDDEREALANLIQLGYVTDWYEAADRILAAGFRRSEVPEPSSVAEMIERSSIGTPEAQALRATVSDEKAAALVAEAHRRSEPHGEPSSEVPEPSGREAKIHGELVTMRVDEWRRITDELARLRTLEGSLEPSAHDDACEADWGAEGQESPCRCAERAQGEPSDAQVEAAWAVLERDGLTVLERIHVRDALRAAGVLCEPSAPDGWFVFGSHAPYPWVGKMEFSAEQDEAGMPLWERPVQGEPSDAQVHAALSVYLDTDRAWADWETWQIESMRVALRAAGGAR